MKAKETRGGRKKRGLTERQNQLSKQGEQAKAKGKRKKTRRKRNRSEQS